MREETGITVVAAIGIAIAVVLVIIVIHHIVNQQNRGPQPGQSQEPSIPQ